MKHNKTAGAQVAVEVPDKVKRAIELAQNRVTLLEADTIRLNNLKDQLQLEVSSLNDGASLLKDQKSSLDSNIADLKGEKEGLETKVDELKKERDSLEGRKDALVAECDAASAKLEIAKLQQGKAADDKAKLVAECTHFDSLLSDKKAKHQSYVDAVVELHNLLA